MNQVQFLTQSLTDERERFEEELRSVALSVQLELVVAFFLPSWNDRPCRNAESRWKERLQAATLDFQR